MKNTQKIKTQFNEEEASWDYAEVWNKFPVPARPSKEELELLKKEIKKLGKNINLLILGSTIEYRSLCKKLGVTPYVADFDETIYKKLTNYSKEKFKNEHFLKVDWLDINETNKYDIIIGHRPFNVIGKEMLGKFFKGMNQSLKSNGVFYCKGNLQFKKHKDQLNNLISRWAFKPKRKYPLFSYIEVELYSHCADKAGYVDYTKARKIASDWIKQKKITQKDYNLIKILISMSSDARFRGKISEIEIAKEIKKAGFKNTKWIILDKDICSNMPIIKMVK